MKYLQSTINNSVFKTSKPADCLHKHAKDEAIEGLSETPWDLTLFGHRASLTHQEPLMSVVDIGDKAVMYGRVWGVGYFFS